MFRRTLVPIGAVGRLLWQPLYGPPGTGAVRPRFVREHGELVSLAFAVCLAIFLVKGFIAYRDLDRAEAPPQIYSESVGKTLGLVGVCCAEDFAVGLGCVLVGGVALRLTRPAGGRRVLRFLAHAAAALALVYVIVNAQIFHVLRRFLTVSLFQLGGGLRPERSVVEGATATVKAAVAFVPPLTLAVHLLWFSKVPRFWSAVPAVVCRPLILLALIAGLSGISVALQRHLFAEYRGDYARNPHLLLAWSLLDDADFGDVGPEEPDTAEFRPGRPRLAAPPLAQRPTKIILIVLESVGARYCGVNGYPQSTTPHLQRLAGRALTFDNFYANRNHTIASALPLFASTWNDPRTLATLIEYPDFPIAGAAGWLRSLGYQTAFLGAGGRQAWEGYRNLAAFVTDFDLGRDRAHPFWREAGARGFWEPDYRDDELFADARRFVRRSAGDKFFLMLWTYDTHWPFFRNEGPTWDERYTPPACAGRPVPNDFTRYLNGIHRADEQIGALYAELERLGIADDTLVLVTGDHGEAFGQHGAFGHGGTLFDEEVRVPLMLINRRLATACGTQRAVLGSHVDLWPTVADICGWPCDPRWQGRSLFGDDADRRTFFACRGAMGVREGRFKFLLDFDRGRERLFDLDADPNECTNVAEEHRDFCRRQRRRLRDWAFFQTGLTKERLLEATHR